MVTFMAAATIPSLTPAPTGATEGLRLRPDPGLRSLDGGTVLLGGAPYRMLRLGPAGARHVAAWWNGEPVADSPGAQALARRLLWTGIAHPVPAGGPGPGTCPADVTVVIPVRDRTAELALCLTGLGEYQVIVVDDGSRDPGAVAAIAAAAGARCVHRAVNGGPAAARNTGLAAVRTPLAAFLDSDCVPAPGWLGPLLPHFRDPAVAAVAPRIMPYALAARTGWLAQYEGVSSTLDMGPVPSIVRPGSKVPYVPGAALVVRVAAAGPKNAGKDAGGFAEHMPVGEDVDFVWRLAAAGWHVRYEPAATVAHQHRVRLGSWFARRMDYGTSAAPLEVRHPGTLPAVAMSGWSATAWAAAALGHPVAGAGITATATALLARRLAPVTGDSWAVATRLAAGGTVAAGRLLGSTLSRAWWPVALPAAIAVPRLRLPLAALVLAPPVLGWRERRPPMDPVRYVSARLLDDVAYSIGVWQGCVRHRTAAPLLPRLTWRAPGGGRSGTGAGAGTGAAGGPRARDPRGPLAAIYGYAARAARRSRPVPAGPESPPGHR
jgi:mycofactocin system glycosyltransferase